MFKSFSILFFLLLFGDGFVVKDPNVLQNQFPKEENPSVVIQLFTSQGCSSCPPADKLLEDIKDKYSGKKVIALAYHVDYWDRLGWKDSFSNHENTELQYNYENHFNYGSVYTPQAIINGKVQFVGSNKAKMNSILTSYLKTNAENEVILSDINEQNGTILLKYKVQGATAVKNLKVALAIDHRDTKIKNGENGGRTLSNSNMVVEEKTVRLEKDTGTIELKVPALVKKEDRLFLAGYVQKNDLSISGATQEVIN